MVERGRWNRPSLDYTMRLCNECQEIEDEYHVVLKCKRFENFRKMYIPKKLINRPSMFEFIKLLDSKDTRVLRKLGLFFYKVMSEYDATVL